MKEQWTQWKPIQGLSKKYIVESILDNRDGLKIILYDEKDLKKQVTVFFDGIVASYKCTDETFRLSTLEFLDENYGVNFYSEWTFFKVTNSAYLKLLSEESHTIADHLSHTHFSLIDSNSIIDIIASYEPIIQLIDINES